AEHHGRQPPSRLAELQVPHHGLDRGGLLVLSTHHHEFLLTMLPDGQVTVEDQSSDATPDRAAERIVDAQVRAIRATYRRERTRLEALLATERSWSPGEWRRLYQDHPITRAVASLLVWRHEFADGGVLEMLPDPYGGASYVRQDDEDGVAAYTRQREEMLTPFRADAQPTSVTLWHPRDADPAALAAWRAIRDERGLAQPFEQIDRDFTRVEPDPDSVELNQHAPAAVDAASFEAALTGLDWHSHRSKAGRLSDAIRLVHRDFPDARLSVTVPCREGGETVVLGAGWFYRTQDRARTALALGYVPPRVYSEALRDLAVLARGALPTAGGSFNTEMNDRIEF
ncbi:MAG TPA: DUF4132 domain-containing protein, partial [Actinospica sp.]|nr:DUF4132 domain-containing protein [Actinospica sp.]